MLHFHSVTKLIISRVSFNITYGLYAVWRISRIFDIINRKRMAHLVTKRKTRPYSWDYNIEQELCSVDFNPNDEKYDSLVNFIKNVKESRISIVTGDPSERLLMKISLLYSDSLNPVGRVLYGFSGKPIVNGVTNKIYDSYDERLLDFNDAKAQLDCTFYYSRSDLGPVEIYSTPLRCVQPDFFAMVSSIADFEAEDGAIVYAGDFNKNELFDAIKLLNRIVYNSGALLTQEVRDRVIDFSLGIGFDANARSKALTELSDLSNKRDWADNEFALPILRRLGVYDNLRDGGKGYYFTPATQEDIDKLDEISFRASGMRGAFKKIFKKKDENLELEF